MLIAYPYLGKLAGDAKAIVVGKVSDIRGIRVDDSTKIPFTDFTVSVESSIKGGLQRGDKIIVGQLGSTQFTNATSDEDALMKVVERYVLFLDYDPNTKVYYPLGGPQGRYLLDENNLVYDMNVVSHGKYSFIEVKADGKPLNDFTKEILAAVANPDSTKPAIEQEKPGYYEKPLNGTTSNAGNQTVAGGAQQ